MGIGNRIAMLRRDKGWTQKTLADAAGLSKDYLADIEQGRRRAKLKTLAIIAARLGVGVEKLYEGGGSVLAEIEKRIFINAYERARLSDDYTGNVKTAIKLGQKIMKLLGPYGFLFLEYEKMISKSEIIYLKNVYSIGVKNGQKLRC